ncbi:MAG: helix-turn-helix transcriptional regulator [Armatimonadetes bacterium]|nr:helix-turn-helix transcriptional regulator [Armatimonadota bacterium]
MLSVHGFTDDSIANKLGIARATVSTYWGRIRAKVGHLSRPELAMLVGEQAASAASQDIEERLRAEIEARKHLEVMLLQREERLERLIQAMPDPCIKVARDGTLLGIYPQTRAEPWYLPASGRLGENAFAGYAAPDSLADEVRAASEALRSRCLRSELRVGNRSGFFELKFIPLCREEILVVIAESPGE